MTYLGDIRLGDTIDCKFCTVTTTGAPTTLAGTPVVSAYPGNSTTQLTAGITLTVDFDGVTGLHNVRVVASGGNGYATATNYQLVITTGTVGGTSVVGYVVGQFSIEARSAVMPTTAARTLDVSAGGEAGVDWANVGTPGSTVSLSATTVATVTTATTATNVTTVNGLAANVITATAIQNDAITAAKIANAAIDAATFAADVDAEMLSYIVDDATRIDASALNAATVTTIPAIVADTNELQTDWANGGRLDLILDARASQTSVDDLPTNAELATSQASADDATLAAIAGLNNISAAQVNAEVVDVLRVDALSELSQAAPSATPTMAQALMMLYMSLRNAGTTTATTLTISDNAGVVICKATLSDDGTTFTKSEFVSGP